MADQLVFKAIREMKFKFLQQDFTVEINQFPKVQAMHHSSEHQFPEETLSK